MTLRIVSDNHEPDGVLYCRHSAGCWRPATILVSFLGKHYLPSCDPCARLTYEHHPDQTAFAPLAGYVDTFAAAKAAALATPEHVIQTAGVQVVGPTIVDDEVCRHIWRDEVVYCRMRWCGEGGRLTPADQRLNAIGGLWYTACADCIAKFDPAQVEVAPMSEADTAWELEMIDKYRNEHKSWTKPKPPMSRRAKILWWTVPAAVLALGITMVSIGHMLWDAYYTADDRWFNHQGSGGVLPDTAGWTGWGTFFIVVSSLVLAGVFIAWLVSEATSVPAGHFRVPKAPRQQYSAGSYQQGSSVPWYQNPDVVNAMLLGGVVVAAHEATRRHQARLRDSALGIAPLNNTAAGMRQAYRIQQRQGTTDPQQATLQELRWLNDERPRWVRS
jgi:hypothetical protein